MKQNNHNNDRITMEMLEAYDLERVSVKELIDAGWDAVSVWMPHTDFRSSFVGEYAFVDGEIVGFNDEKTTDAELSKAFVRPVSFERYEYDDEHVAWRAVVEASTHYSSKVSIPSQLLERIPVSVECGWNSELGCVEFYVDFDNGEQIKIAEVSLSEAPIFASEGHSLREIDEDYAKWRDCAEDEAIKQGYEFHCACEEGPLLKMTRYKYLGKRVRVWISTPRESYCGREGIVRYVDGTGQLHGTWGSLAAIPGEDKIQVLDNENN